MSSLNWVSGSLLWTASGGLGFGGNCCCQKTPCTCLISPPSTLNLNFPNGNLGALNFILLYSPGTPPLGNPYPSTALGCVWQGLGLLVPGVLNFNAFLYIDTSTSAYYLLLNGLFSGMTTVYSNLSCDGPKKGFAYLSGNTVDGAANFGNLAVTS